MLFNFDALMNPTHSTVIMWQVLKQKNNNSVLPNTEKTFCDIHL